jgi:hypothetical protein
MIGASRRDCLQVRHRRLPRSGVDLGIGQPGVVIDGGADVAKPDRVLPLVRVRSAAVDSPSTVVRNAAGSLHVDMDEFGGAGVPATVLRRAGCPDGKVSGDGVAPGWFRGGGASGCGLRSVSGHRSQRGSRAGPKRGRAQPRGRPVLGPGWYTLGYARDGMSDRPNSPLPRRRSGTPTGDRTALRSRASSRGRPRDSHQRSPPLDEQALP